MTTKTDPLTRGAITRPSLIGGAITSVTRYCPTTCMLADNDCMPVGYTGTWLYSAAHGTGKDTFVCGATLTGTWQLGLFIAGTFSHAYKHVGYTTTHNL